MKPFNFTKSGILQWNFNFNTELCIWTQCIMGIKIIWLGQTGGKMSGNCRFCSKSGRRNVRQTSKINGHVCWAGLYHYLRVVKGLYTVLPKANTFLMRNFNLQSFKILCELTNYNFRLIFGSLQLITVL